jgi:hypothetical protein
MELKRHYEREKEKLKVTLEMDEQDPMPKSK